MNDVFRWRCSFCDHNAVITSSNYHVEGTVLSIDNADGPHHASLVFIVCPNTECRKFTFSVALHHAYRLGVEWREGSLVRAWKLIPASEAKVFPAYIPEAIREDYLEACLIRDLSPKASATLARRCLQGMIRDFWSVKKPTLKQEIEAIKDRIDPLTWQAIEAVRNVGNIGAHMEKDINLIVEVEPEEAARLITLIELLIHDWYVIRHERQESLKAIVALGEAKEQARTPSPEPEPGPEETARGEAGIV